MEQRAAMEECENQKRVIEACQRGDREAFRLLFEAHKDKVYSIAIYFFGGDEEGASDATQQVFLKLITSINQFRQDAEFTTWLYRLVVNACVDEQRKKRRFIPFGEAFETKSGAERKPQEEHFARAELAGSVRQAVAHLKPKLRMAVLLKYVEGLSYEEIGAALGCSKGTVASRLNRGHKILARRLSHLRDEFH